tara:strand:- start:428 stop:715 length:288 start_codon:yes stop_codon:yes gene_type:complete
MNKPYFSFKSNNCVQFTLIKSEIGFLHVLVNKKFGNAPSRNTLKRRVRVLYKTLNLDSLEYAFTLKVRPLKQNISFVDLKNSFHDLNQKILNKGI